MDPTHPQLYYIPVLAQSDSKLIHSRTPSLKETPQPTRPSLKSSSYQSSRAFVIDFNNENKNTYPRRPSLIQNQASTTMPIKAAAKARQKPHDDYPWIAPTPITRPGFQRPTRSNSGSYSIVSIPPPDPRTGSRVLRALTVNLLSTFERKDPEFLYSPEKRNPKRTLTKPCEPAKNDGYDNEDCDYILRVHDILGENDQQYRVVDLLGHGTFGQVVKCQHIRTGELMSVKVIKNKLAFRKQSKMEAEILKRLYRRVPRDQRHSLLTLHDTFDHKNHLCLVLELLSVNLYELLGQNGFKGLPLPLVRTISKQLLETLVLLRTAKVIHCDIKPENILLKEVDKPDIKLVDFGSACQESKQMYSYIQSRFYRSPEVILGMPYSYEIDVWSTGAVVAELYLGIPIFPGSSEYDQLRRITEMLGVPPHSMLRHARNTGRYFNQVTGDGKLPDHKLKSAQQYSQEQGTTELLGKKYFAHTDLESIILHHRASKRQSAQDTLSSEEQRRAIADFCKGLLQLDPRKRWTAAQALQHPFITGAPYTGAFDPFKCIFPEQEKQNAALETKQKLSSGGSRSSASSNVDVSRKVKIAPMLKVRCGSHESLRMPDEIHVIPAKNNIRTASPRLVKSDASERSSTFRRAARQAAAGEAAGGLLMMHHHSSGSKRSSFSKYRI